MPTNGFYVPSYLDVSNGNADFKRLADSFGQSGPLRIKPVSSGYTVTVQDGEWMLRLDKGGTVYIPEDGTDPIARDAFPVGTRIAIANSSAGRVIVQGIGNVVISGPVRNVIDRWRVGVLMKYSANFWLLSLGSGGGTGPSVPLAPKLNTATAGPAQVTLAWTAPTDDGGSPITSYLVEYSTNQKDWITGTSTGATTLTTVLKPLTPGTLYYVRVKAVNLSGVSDGSNILSATPSEPFNDAEGGTVSYYDKDGKRFRVHTFTASAGLNVKSAVKPFRVLCVGGGSNGGNGDSRGGGGGGVVEQDLLTLTTGVHPVNVPGAQGTASFVSPGGTNIVVAPGSGNGDPGPNGGVGANNGGGGGQGAGSDISGTFTRYSGGGGSVDWNYCCPARGGEGGDKGGGAWECGRQHATWYGAGGGRVQHTCPDAGRGYQGIVYVSYEVDPSTSIPAEQPKMQEDGEPWAVVTRGGNIVVDILMGSRKWASEWTNPHLYLAPVQSVRDWPNVGLRFFNDRHFFEQYEAEPDPEQAAFEEELEAALADDE